MSAAKEKTLISDIYQNCGLGYSATILLVAPMTPLPAAPTKPLSPCFCGLFSHVSAPCVTPYEQDDLRRIWAFGTISFREGEGLKRLSVEAVGAGAGDADGDEVPGRVRGGL